MVCGEDPLTIRHCPTLCSHSIYNLLPAFMPANFQLYYITDRLQLKKRSIESCISAAVGAGIDWVQIREKDLPARGVVAITEYAARRAAERGKTRVIVNDRLDVALAANAQGVHLATRSMPAGVVRKLAPKGFLVGVSCHSLEEAMAAEMAGANYLLLGPIFETPSKLNFGAPLGLEMLREVTGQISLPVFALGGITVDRISQCRESGAAGIAGIRIFQDCDSMEELVGQLRGQRL